MAASCSKDLYRDDLFKRFGKSRHFINLTETVGMWRLLAEQSNDQNGNWVSSCCGRTFLSVAGGTKLPEIILRCCKNQSYVAAKISLTLLQKSVLRCRKNQYYVAAKISITLLQKSVLRGHKNQFYVAAKICIT